MKLLLKQSGIIIMFLGIIILSYAMFAHVQNNTILIWSLVLILLGMIAYVVINRYLE